MKSKQGAVLPIDEAPVTRDVTLQPTENTAVMFERLVTDPNVSVDKIERLMALWERGEAKNAELAFNAAMSAAQTEMRPVATDAHNPQTHSRYASYKALDEALRPIYTKHGFGLSFNTSADAPPDYVRVLCYVTHAKGHSRTYHADMPADGKGAKGGDVMTKTHAAGSAMTYGMRYLLKMIFNVAVGDEDDDGNRASGAVATPDVPTGYDDWLLDLAMQAKQGTVKLFATWNKSKPEYRQYVTKHERAKWDALKAEAERVK